MEFCRIGKLAIVCFDLPFFISFILRCEARDPQKMELTLLANNPNGDKKRIEFKPELNQRVAVLELPIQM